MNNKMLKMGIVSCIVMSSLGVAMPITCAAEPAEKLSTSEVVVTCLLYTSIVGCNGFERVGVSV